MGLIGTGAAPQTAPAAEQDLVIDTTTERFALDVLEASLKQPVIVDFWAPWCGPCKQLGPMLEKLVRMMKGVVRMVKLDIEAHPEIAQHMRIQSIPAVFAFFQGKPVDGFMGALPEAQLKQWLERLVKLATSAGVEATNPLQEIAAALQTAEAALAEGDAATAQAIYGQVLQADPAHAGAYAGVIRCFLVMGDATRAKQLFMTAPPEMAKDKAFATVRAALELAEQAASAGPVDDLAARVQANPADHQARYDYALALIAKDKKQEAVDQLLEIVKRDRKWNEEAARKQLVKLLEALGFTDPIAIETRKRLSSILFS